MRRSLAAGLCVLVLSPLAACGGEPTTEDYCELLSSERQRIADLVADDDPGALLDDLSLFADLRAAAPRDLRDEWDTFLGALRQLRDTLDDVGVDASDFTDGKPPASLSQADREAVVTAADRVRDADVVAAASGIETQARDVCKINLGL